MKNKKIKMLLLAIVLSISCFLTCFATTIQVAYASSIGIVGGYTNVLEDLQKDDTFDADDYPVIQDDYSLQVITIAESTDKELFVYVYQPSANYGNLRASSLFISTSYHSRADYSKYDLSFVNSNGVFYKYLVCNFVVADDSVRSYEITNIYRKFDSAFDTALDNGNTIDYVSFPIQKTFTFSLSDNNCILNISDNEYITVTDKFVGFVRYDGETNFWGNEWKCDSHFIAFSTDREIDELQEADVYFCYSPYEYEDYLSELYVEKSNGETKTYYGCKKVSDIGSYICSLDCSPYEGYAYLTGEQSGSYASGKWHYNWNRIQSVSEFIDSENNKNVYDNGFISVSQSNSLTDDAKKDIETKDWVLRFYESEYKYETGLYGGLYYGSVVYNVSILRLKFQTAGLVYDLGVLDNMQSGDFSPSNNITYDYSISDMFKIIMFILLLVVFVLVLSPFLPTLFNVLWAIIKYIFKALIWLVSAPFKLIGKVFKKRE